MLYHIFKLVNEGCGFSCIFLFRSQLDLMLIKNRMICEIFFRLMIYETL